MKLLVTIVVGFFLCIVVLSVVKFIVFKLLFWGAIAGVGYWVYLKYLK